MKQIKESLFYTYSKTNDVQVVSNSEHIKHLVNASQFCEEKVFTIDFCTKSATKTDSYKKNKNHNFVSLQANYTAYFNEIPTAINDENTQNIRHINDVRNFLAFYGSNVDLLKNSNHDMVLIEPFLYGSSNLVNPIPLRVKKNKGQRLVLAYMSVSELREDLHYFSAAAPYQDECAPVDSEYGYLTQKFWMRGWHRILIENLEAIVTKGYDGVFFDRIDSYCDQHKRKNAPSCLA
jgi:endo-alpha-1,4-polygalactosaminidase (GH114 family)